MNFDLNTVVNGLTLILARIDHLVKYGCIMKFKVTSVSVKMVHQNSFFNVKSSTKPKIGSQTFSQELFL